MMKSEWKKLQKDQLMKGKKDKPAKKVDNLAQVEHIDDDEDYQADSDAASVSSHNSSSQNIERKSGKKKVKHQPGLMTKVLRCAYLKKL